MVWLWHSSLSISTTERINAKLPGTTERWCRLDMDRHIGQHHLAVLVLCSGEHQPQRGLVVLEARNGDLLFRKRQVAVSGLPQTIGSPATETPHKLAP
mgnify:CR=1 FL=1